MITVKTMDEVGELASKETLRRLVSGHQGLYNAPVVLVEWDQAPNCIWPIRLPECMGTASQGYGEYQRYYLWKRSKDGCLTFEQAPITDPRFRGHCSAEVSLDGDQMNFSLSVTNQSKQTWPRFFMHVCLLHIFTRRSHEDSFVGNHFVFGQGDWTHVHDITPEFPELEFAWCSIKGQEGFTEGFRDRGHYLRPFTASKNQLDSERVYQGKLQKVTLRSENAAMLGWSGWPCTDMALTFGDVAPDETKAVNGTVAFSSTSGPRR